MATSGSLTGMCCGGQVGLVRYLKTDREGFLLVCEVFWGEGLTIRSPPVPFFFFFFKKLRSARAHQFDFFICLFVGRLVFGNDQSTVAQRAETIVSECP